MLQQHGQRRGLLDTPNHRSSHVQPTPTGGGWIFTGLSLVAAVGLVVWYSLPLLLIPMVLLPLAVVSFTGGLDDLRPLSPHLRLLIQVLSSALVSGTFVLFNPGLKEAGLLATLLGLVALVGMVWFTNLYNFMDGIDGIAAVQAITVLLSWGVVHISAGQDLTQPGILMAAVITGSLLGFLVINWSPAGIFMGDVGSGFLGFGLAIVLLYLLLERPQLWLAYALPCGVFWVDASYTLLRRILTGQAFLQAHRSHTYQILARRWQSHSKVVIAMAVYNGVWLLPLAIFTVMRPEWGILWLTAAWLPLLWLAWKCEAGLKND